MRGIFKKFQDTVFGAPPASKDDAKQRLKVLLIHDQVALTPAQLDAMREEIMDVISRYVEVDDKMKAANAPAAANSAPQAAAQKPKS